ncbi:hypothetical protein AAFF_G00345610 [Aldrovandia affinis]|uniref:Uncharacterized protein n=1 Tax=Aldrovandia affinis TaxID=143900 RepID=A0AAD7VZ02_9TELE|nr:hypothetical protein AAFF_G00345610 [Aldrovandia affinis]
MILGTNVLKHLLRRFKQDPSYWRVMNQADSSGEQSIEQFLSMLSGITRWKGDRIPDTIGTVKLTSAVTLMPRHEHIVWGKLPSNAPVSEGKCHCSGAIEISVTQKKHPGRENCGFDEW